VGALAVAVVRAQLERRGEHRALLLTGAAPWRVLVGAALGAMAPGLVAALWLGAAGPPLGSLFPALELSPWVATPGGYAAPSLGLALDAQGQLAGVMQAAHGAASRPGHALVAAAVALPSVLAPLWLSAPASMAARAAFGGASLAAAVLAFHLVALGRPAAWLFAPAAVLAAACGLQAAGQRWAPGRSPVS
jgi:hypothetical protein